MSFTFWNMWHKVLNFFIIVIFFLNMLFYLFYFKWKDQEVWLVLIQLVMQREKLINSKVNKLNKSSLDKQCKIKLLCKKKKTKSDQKLTQPLLQGWISLTFAPKMFAQSHFSITFCCGRQWIHIVWSLHICWFLHLH